MHSRLNRGTHRSRPHRVSLLALLLAMALIAPLAGSTGTAWAQYGGITPNAPYDQSRRVARRTARRTTRRNVDYQQQYQQPYQQPYPQQPQPYPQQPYPPQYPQQ